LPRLAKVNARRGMSGKQKISCILVIAKVTARRGMSGKQKTFYCFSKSSITVGIRSKSRALALQQCGRPKVALTYGCL
jgi:hypothetical protein